MKINKEFVEKNITEILKNLSPVIGVILGTIGLSITKDKKHKDRDITLNIIGIGVSIIVWMVSFALLI